MQTSSRALDLLLLGCLAALLGGCPGEGGNGSVPNDDDVGDDDDAGDDDVGDDDSALPDLSLIGNIRQAPEQEGIVGATITEIGNPRNTTESVTDGEYFLEGPNVERWVGVSALWADNVPASAWALWPDTGRFPTMIMLTAADLDGGYQDLWGVPRDPERATMFVYAMDVEEFPRDGLEVELTVDHGDGWIQQDKETWVQQDSTGPGGVMLITNVEAGVVGVQGAGCNNPDAILVGPGELVFVELICE